MSRQLKASVFLSSAAAVLALPLRAQYDMHNYFAIAPGYAVASVCDNPGTSEAQYLKPTMCSGYPNAWSHVKGAYRTNTTPGSYVIPWSNEPFYEANYTHDGVTEPFIWITAEIGQNQYTGGITTYTAFRTLSTGIKGYAYLPRWIPTGGTNWSVATYVHELWYKKTTRLPDYTLYPQTGCPSGRTVCGGFCAYPSCIGDCNVVPYTGGVHAASASHVTLTSYLIDLRNYTSCPSQMPAAADVDAIRLSYSYASSYSEHYYYGRWYDPTISSWVSLGLVKWEALENGVVQQTNLLKYLVGATFGDACTTCPP